MYATATRGDFSPLFLEKGPYLNEIAESASFEITAGGDDGNGNTAPGGTYTWIVGENGKVFGAYTDGAGVWYAGFGGTYP